MSRIIEKENGCWEYPLRHTKCGYGTIYFGGFKVRKHILVHRLMYEEFKDKIPKGLFVLHTCDNPPCCNPSHLFLGTHQDNMDDMWKKGRSKVGKGENSRNWKYSDKEIDYVRNHPGPYRKIIEETGMSKSQISYIKNNKTRV